MEIASFKRQRDPLPGDPLGQRLCQIFPYAWKAIVRSNESDSRWTTVRYCLSPRLLWKKWNNASELLGVRFGHETCYAVIDIDRGSAYHPAQNPESLQLIRAALETIGICRTILIRSSWSGGLHLYIPLPYEFGTFGVAKSIKRCIEAQGLTIAQGQLEIFPNCKAYAPPGKFTEYNGHQLPLQPDSGSCLLDDDGNPATDNLATFFQQWDLAASGQDLESLNEAINVARAKRGRANKGFSRNLESWKQDLDTEIEEGWTNYGQTNHLLGKIACRGLVFESLQGDNLTEYIVATAVESPGYRQWSRHQHEIQTKAKAWARAAENYYWPIGSNPKRPATGHVDDKEVVSLNIVRSNDAQRRIREAVARLEQSGQFPAKATARLKAIQQVEKISSRTIYRYPELWHPDNYQADSSEQCKTPEPEPLPEISATKSEQVPKRLKPLPDGKFYTLKKNMKGKSDGLEPNASKSWFCDRLSFLAFNSNSLEKPNDESLKSEPIATKLNLLILDSQRIELNLSSLDSQNQRNDDRAKKPIFLVKEQQNDDRLENEISTTHLWQPETSCKSLRRSLRIVPNQRTQFGEGEINCKNQETQVDLQ